MNNLKSTKAITLIALIITIIILLILAGISIQAITKTGLFEAAGRAKKEAKRAQVVEWLNLKLLENQSEKPAGTVKDIINATHDSVKNNIGELQKIGKEVKIEDTKTEEDEEKIDSYFYVQVDKDVYKVEIKGAKYIGEAGKLQPIITIKSVTSTSNSITVKVSTIRNENGRIEYWIKGEGEKEYNREAEISDENYTYEGLEQNKKYSIKIVAIAENNKTSEVIKEDILVGSIPELKQEDIIVTRNTNDWTNGNVTVTAKLKEGITRDYILKITDSNPEDASKETALRWENAVDGITVNTNKTIYVVLVDDKGQIGKAATVVIDNIDKTAPSVPTITYNGGSNTCNWKNSYNITLNSTDSQSGVDHYQIDYQGDGNVDTDNVSSNFIPNNGYDSCKVRFRAVDKVGNVSEWTEEQHIHMDTSVLRNNGTYYIHSSNSSKNVMNINGNYITEDAANAEIWGKTSVADNGKFTIVNVTGEWYKIVCKASGKVLDVDAGVGEDGRNVRQYAYNGTDAQLWKFIDAGDGNYYIQSKLGYNLDVYTNSTEWGTNVIIYHPNETTAQKWKLIATQ